MVKEDKKKTIKLKNLVSVSSSRMVPKIVNEGEKRRKIVFLNEDLHRELKIITAKLGISMGQFASIAIREHIKRNKLEEHSS